MILLWSPHTSGATQRVLHYLLAPEVSVTLGGQHERIHRDPPPELLRGCPARVACVINAMETKRTYTCATLSFAKNEVDITMWQRSDPEIRRRVDVAIDLWFETAYPGIAPAARPPMLVGTHLHTGRLEINILVPACLLLERRGRLLPRSYNVQPPCKPRDDPWVAYQNFLNHAFNWRDPRDPANAAAVRGPSWMMKRAAQLDRWSKVNLAHVGENGTDPGPDLVARIADEDPRIQILLAARILARTGARNRDELLAGLAPVLADLGWQIDCLRDDTLHLAGGPVANQVLVLRGTLCSAAPPMPLPLEISARAHVQASAAGRLASLSAARAATHAARYPGLPAAVLPHPTDIFARPCPAAPPLSVRLRRLAAALLRRLGDGNRLNVVRAAFRAFGLQYGGFDAPRRIFARLAAAPPIPAPEVAPRALATPSPSYARPAPDTSLSLEPFL